MHFILSRKSSEYAWHVVAAGSNLFPVLEEGIRMAKGSPEYEYIAVEQTYQLQVTPPKEPELKWAQIVKDSPEVGKL